MAKAQTSGMGMNAPKLLAQAFLWHERAQEPLTLSNFQIFKPSKLHFLILQDLKPSRLSNVQNVQTVKA